MTFFCNRGVFEYPEVLKKDTGVTSVLVKVGRAAIKAQESAHRGDLIHRTGPNLSTPLVFCEFSLITCTVHALLR